MYNSEKAHYIAVTGIILKDGKYLIAKRAEWEPDFPNKWTVPGGKVSMKDYSHRTPDTEGGKQWYNVLEEALRREVREEVGLEIRDIGYVTNLVFIRKDNIPCMVVSLFGYAVSDDVKLNKDLSEYKWVSVEEAKKYDMIEGIAEEIEMVDNFLKTGKVPEWKSLRK
ncbi:MAG: NUDIX domain-containing protein [Nanoarchaeota archaeon]